MNSYLHYLAMLQAKAMPIEKTISSTKKGAFDWCDVAGAMAHLNRRQQLLLLLKGTSDHGVWQEIHYLISLDVCAIMIPKWTNSKSARCDPYRVQRMVVTTMIEWASPPICPKCGGHAERYAEVEREICNRCYGASTVRLKSSARAAGLGLSKTAFNKVWRSRYEDVLAHLYSIEESGSTKFVDQIRKK